MTRFFTLLASTAIASWTVLGHAQASMHGSAPQCPNNGFLSIDGCSGAPAYNNSSLSFLDRAFFSDGSAFQTPGMTTAGVSSITWNVAGVNYPVGVSPGVYCNGGTKPCSTGNYANLIDASAYAWATRAATDGVCNGGAVVTNPGDGTFQVNCKISDGSGSSTAVANLQGFDFSPGGVCITLKITETGTATGVGTVVFKNNHYTQPASGHACYTNRYDASGTLTTQQFYLAPNITAAHPWNFDVENNWLDQNVVNVHSDGTSGIIAMVSTGGDTVKYNFFGVMPSRAVNATFCTYLDFDYNVTPSAGYWPNDSHGEFDLSQVEYDGTHSVYCNGLGNTTLVDHISYIGNVMVTPYNAGGTSGMNFQAPHLLNISAGPGITVGPPALGGLALDVELNTGVVNYVAPSEHFFMSYLDSGSITLNTGGVVGNYDNGDVVTVQATGCSPYPTVKLYCTGGGSCASAALKPDEWTGGNCGATAPSAGPWNTTGGNGSGLTVSINNYAQFASGNGVMALKTTSGTGQLEFTSAAIANNALDPFGSEPIGQPIVISPYAGTTICAGSLTTTGNFNLETGASIAFPSGITGC